MDDLRKLAEAATPGPWKYATPNTVRAGRFNVVPNTAAGGSGVGLAGKSDAERANAAYIAACSPDRILRLLDAVDKAREVLSVYEQFCIDDSRGYASEYAALRTALAALEAEQKERTP